MKQIEIPIKPLSVNKAWQGRRFKTPDYKNWQKEFSYLVEKQTPLKGNIGITIEFYIKNDKMSDVDNFLKTLLDTLKDTNIIEDDRKIQEIHAYKYHSEDQKIRITISNT